MATYRVYGTRVREEDVYLDVEADSAWLAAVAAKAETAEVHDRVVVREEVEREIEWHNAVVLNKEVEHVDSLGLRSTEEVT